MTDIEKLADIISANSLIWVQGRTECRWLSEAERDVLLRLLCSPDAKTTLHIHERD